MVRGRCWGIYIFATGSRLSSYAQAGSPPAMRELPLLRTVHEIRSRFGTACPPRILVRADDWFCNFKFPLLPSIKSHFSRGRWPGAQSGEGGNFAFSFMVWRGGAGGRPRGWEELASFPLEGQLL